MQKCALILCSKTGFGGAERRLLRIYANLSKEMDGICVLFQASTTTDTAQLMEKMGIDASSFDAVKFFYTRRKLVREIMFGGYKVLHFADVSLLWTVIAILAKMQGIKTIETIANVFLAQGTAPLKFRFLAKVMWKFADRIDLLYPFYIDSVRQTCKHKIVSCTPGTFTDLELFQPTEKKKVLFFCAARLSDEKKPLLLIEALRLAADNVRKNGYRVIIAGRYYREEEMKFRIQQYNMSDFVEMLGYVAPQEHMLSAEAVFSLQIPNYPSQVVAEACASGCCVIATKCRLNPPTFLNESFALFCEDNAHSLADVISRFIEMDEEEKTRLGQSARKHAEKYFGIEKSVLYFKAIIQDLL